MPRPAKPLYLPLLGRLGRLNAAHSSQGTSQLHHTCARTHPTVAPTKRFPASLPRPRAPPVYTQSLGVCPDSYYDGKAPSTANNVKLLAYDRRDGITSVTFQCVRACVVPRRSPAAACCGLCAAGCAYMRPPVCV